MISEPINLTTGPVAITSKVRQALSETPVSHRSVAFQKLYDQATDFLSENFCVKNTFLLTGSGTLANEAMLQEIKQLNEPGLILSNGEFGRRLVEQASRNGLQYITYALPWGERFDLHEIKRLLSTGEIEWLLFCHCETSTGVINDLDAIAALAHSYGVKSFVDCMSTVGTRKLDLSAVTMATCSSGKGLASVPGIAIVFSNYIPSEKTGCPVYLDLGRYATAGGVPFTLSSNLLKALLVAARQKLQTQQHALVDHFGAEIFSVLKAHGIAPFSSEQSKVFTIDNTRAKDDLVLAMKKDNVLLSEGSGYLMTRGWCQLATFGYYEEDQLLHAVKSLSSALA